MIPFKVEGVIFDVDDTLLDNEPGHPGEGLHEKARLRAVHEVGEKYNIQKLIDLSVTDNLNAFLNAPVHSLEAAVWEILLLVGIADTRIINRESAIFKEIVQLKDEYYKDILINEGKEVPGATAFVGALEKSGIQRLAIASAAIRRDIYIFLTKTKLKHLFPEERVITFESISHPKPNPEVFNLAFTSLHIPEDKRGNVIAFEDDPRGIMAAKGAGLFTCAITTRYSKKFLLSCEIPPDYVGESYEEFAEYFNIKKEFNSFKMLT
jgi:HAD superfamily hydrolase (TIGR01509 family)